MKKIIPLLIILCFVTLNYGQDYKQTVRGCIIDKESHVPVPFAAIQLMNTKYQATTLSNEEGDFRFESVPVGRITLKISCLGYQGMTITNLEVTTGNELVVNPELVESVIKLAEVSVKAFHNKEKPLNDYAPVSARTFSVEESHRYAGSGNDVSKMAMNFAGVSQLTETSNEIIIRGNTPVGLLFRLEGVDIPNPSHFGDGGTTGGPISMLNNKLLANSDFMTGAFPAEYGNAISGVFDLRMRNGNSEKHEFIAQAGLMGFEGLAEGPIFRKQRASYLVNYRYSTPAILRALGMNIMGTAVIDYQDLSVKLNFPSRRFGTISLFVLGGKGLMKMFDSERDTTEEKLELAYESEYEMDMQYENYTGVVGLSHSFILSDKAYTRFILSATTIWNYQKLDSLSTINRKPVLSYFSDFSRTKYTAKFYLNKKFNSRNAFRVGISTELLFFNMLDSVFIPVLSSYCTLRDYQGNDMLSQAYIQYRHRFSDQLQLTFGLHSMLQHSNKNISLEPRTGLNWEFLPGHSFSLGYGLHSMCCPIEIAHQELILENGAAGQQNSHLDYIKSHHFILGYNALLTEKLRLKTEAYYQYLTDVPVDIEASPYSFLNRDPYGLVDVKALQNEGKAFNYGCELTLEKFMDHGGYFLATVSLFESKYRGSDGILRNTAYNTNYMLNLLGGKEFTIRNRNKKARFIKKFLIDGKLNWAGGQRYTPIDLETSRTVGITMYDYENAYSGQLKDYFRIDLRIGYKWTGRNASHEIALDIRNVTNRENPFQIKYDHETGEIKTVGMGLTPDLLYRVRF